MAYKQGCQSALAMGTLISSCTVGPSGKSSVLPMDQETISIAADVSVNIGYSLQYLILSLAINALIGALTFDA